MPKRVTSPGPGVEPARSAPRQRRSSRAHCVGDARRDGRDWLVRRRKSRAGCPSAPPPGSRRGSADRGRRTAGGRPRVGDRGGQQRHLHRRDRDRRLPEGGAGQLHLVRKRRNHHRPAPIRRRVDRQAAAVGPERSAGRSRSGGRSRGNARRRAPGRRARSRCCSTPAAPGKVPEGRHHRGEVVLADREAAHHEALGLLAGWSGKVVCGVIAPASSAAAAVSTFMIEPGV